MADKKKHSSEEIKNEELTDEQANEVTGGSYGPRVHVERVKCTRCGRMVREDETIYTYVNGVRSITCFKCAGVR